MALAVSAALPIATNPITDTAGISAHQPLRSLPNQTGDQTADSATTAAWLSERTPIDIQNGNT
ncbi:MAG TPA: hypothetical protein VHU13_06275 [Solirubrobacteraceae bacterium]|nr:hypothetical protein [Solirubrobacteraceae bacterium]